ncbi:unnamed protein product [Closterium sp. Naga37s-1]|nr:unnamed protein product [Closterium sp. Naga37s-1]
MGTRSVALFACRGMAHGDAPSGGTYGRTACLAAKARLTGREGASHGRRRSAGLCERDWGRVAAEGKGSPSPYLSAPPPAPLPHPTTTTSTSFCNDYNAGGAGNTAATTASKGGKGELALPLLFSAQRQRRELAGTAASNGGNGGRFALACAAEAGVGTREDGGGNGGRVLPCLRKREWGLAGTAASNGGNGGRFSLACAAEAGVGGSSRRRIFGGVSRARGGASEHGAARRIGARRSAAHRSAAHRMFQELKQDKKRRGCASRAAEGEG